jgi:hypothetical protein
VNYIKCIFCPLRTQAKVQLRCIPKSEQQQRHLKLRIKRWMLLSNKDSTILGALHIGSHEPNLHVIHRFHYCFKFCSDGFRTAIAGNTGFVSIHVLRFTSRNRNATMQNTEIKVEVDKKLLSLAVELPTVFIPFFPFFNFSFFCPVFSSHTSYSFSSSALCQGTVQDLESLIKLLGFVRPICSLLTSRSGVGAS